MKLNDRISETSWFTWLDMIKTWGSIFIVTAIVGSCSYWLEQDDKRMYKAFMQDCRELQIERDEIVDKEKCAIKWYKGYRETFGRNP